MPREASGGLARDHWLPLGSGFEHGLPVVLSHVVFAGVDPYRVVHDAVEDCVGDGVAAEPVVPFLGRRLGGERGAGRVVAELHEPGWESFEWLVGLVDEPFVDGGRVVGGVFAHGPGHAARLVRRHADLFGGVGHADADRAVACPARGFRQRA